MNPTRARTADRRGEPLGRTTDATPTEAGREPETDRRRDRRGRRTDRSGDGATRRRLLEGAAGTVAVAVTGVGTAETAGGDGDRVRAEPAGRRDGITDQPLIDAHAHLVPEETLGRGVLDADRLVAWMDENGIDRAVVLALDSPESYPVMAPSPWILDQAEAYPDRLVPFCTVDPRTLVYGADTVAELLERYVERGARGVGELKAGVPIDDSRLEVVYELCAEYELPILFHTDDKAMLDEVGLPRLEDVLASFPEVDFVAHAVGWWSHIAADVGEADLGDYPEGEIDEPGRVPELLAEYDNVYGDLSAPSGWNAISRDEAFAQEFLETHADQLVFGTDYLYPGQEIPQFELFDRFELTASAWADVRYRNLAALLR